MENILQRIYEIGIIPVIAIDDAEQAATANPKHIRIIGYL